MAPNQQPTQTIERKSSPRLERIAETWEHLGSVDPLWAVAAAPNKRYGKWDLDEFLNTGEEIVAQYFNLLESWGDGPSRFDHVLDFGCGCGRLCRALSKRALKVTGVDISQSMIDLGRKIVGQNVAVEFVLNLRDDLSCFPSATFDLVCSHVCLQHMPWEIAAKYVVEFGRITTANGLVVLHLPCSNRGNAVSAIRKRIVDAIPFGLGDVYRKWRHGTAAVFEMHYTPAEIVERVALSSGLGLVHKEPCASNKGGPLGYIYVFHKRGIA